MWTEEWFCEYSRRRNSLWAKLIQNRKSRSHKYHYWCTIDEPILNVFLADILYVWLHWNVLTAKYIIGTKNWIEFFHLIYKKKCGHWYFCVVVRPCPFTDQLIIISSISWNLTEIQCMCILDLGKVLWDRL